MNPNDLISREAALKAIRALCDVTDCNISIMPDVAEVLRELPAVNAAQVVHGRWNIDAKNHCSCSRCLYGRNITTQIGWNYCPNCGAKMEGPNDDN